MSSQRPATGPDADRFARALRLTEDDVAARVSGVTMTPHWIEGDQFWFAGPRGMFGVVDPDAGTVRAIERPPPNRSGVPPPGALRSPDGQWDLLRREGNLTLSAVTNGTEILLTTDAEPWWDYAGSPDTSVSGLTLRRSGAPVPPFALWSPRSDRLVTHRIDQRSVRQLPLVEAAPAQGTSPVLHEVRVPFPGDTERPIAELLVFDVPAGTRRSVGPGPLEVQFFSPLELGWVWWGADSDVLWCLVEARGARALSLHRIDLSAGTSELMIEEYAPLAPDQEHPAYVEPHPLLPWPNDARLVRGETVLVWPSERDGWRHLYRYDLDRLPALEPLQLTQGDWTVRDVIRVDEEWVWFTGLGREAGLDPYLRHLYRVPLAGGQVELLTPETGDHSVTFTPSGRYFIDSVSTVATPPVHRLRRSNGSAVCELGRADISSLIADGWRPPEAFSVTAADGRTELYGALFLPSDFDPSRRYPVVDSIYPGPQLIRTPKSFTVDRTAMPDGWPGPWEAQALAELGFVVVTVDGRGTPLRSREFHLASYGQLGNYALDDHVAALRELGAARPWMDLERVGIIGHSAGGGAVVRALVVRPDVFQAGVAGSGLHDLRRYLAYWAEKYQGLAEETDYQEASNIALAAELNRPLLVLHGELDDNVHPSNTLALVDALLRAGREVEMVLLPGQNHDCATHPEYRRRSWEFLVRHLMK